MNDTTPRSNTNKVKSLGFLARIVTIVIIVSATIISVVFSTMYLQGNGNVSIEFGSGYQTEVKYDGIYNDASKTQNIVDLLQTRVDPLGTSNINIEKSTSTGNYFNVSISKSIGVDASTFINNISRRGYVYLLDSGGHDLLANSFDGKAWTQRKERIVSTDAFSQIYQDTNFNSHQPEVVFSIKNQDLSKEITDVLKSDPNEKIYFYSDIGGLLNYIRNDFDGLQDLVSIIDKEKDPKLQAALKVLFVNYIPGFNDATGEQMYNAIKSGDKSLVNLLRQSENGTYTIKWKYSDADPTFPLSVDTNNKDNTFDPTNPFDPSSDKGSPMNAWLSHINDLILLPDISKFLNTSIVNYKYASYFIGTAVTENVNGAKLTINDDTFNQEKVAAIVNILNAGMAKNNFDVLSFLEVNPTLGAYALQYSLIALLVALAVLSVVILYKYRLLGVVAVAIIALFLVSTLVTFAYLNSIASPETGIALIISFALLLDAILGLFNRLQKEYKSGKTIFNAFKDANKKSLSSAFDGNIIILIVSLTIFWFGSRSIRGFAMMASLSTFGVIVLGIFALRIILYFLLRNNTFENKDYLLGLSPTDSSPSQIEKPKNKFAIKITTFKNYSENTLLHITQWNFWNKASKWVMTGFGVILLASGTLYLVIGANFGQGFDSRIDFTGETAFTGNPDDPNFNLQAQIDKLKDKVNADLQKNNKPFDAIYGSYKLNALTTGNNIIQIIIQTSLKDSQAINFQDYLNTNDTDLSWVYTTNNALSGSLLFENMLLAIAISLITIFIYIFIRFQLTFTIPLILALAFGILLTLALISMLHITISTMIIGVILAVLTLILINSVVIFDNIKEIKLINNDRKNHLSKEEIIAISNEGIKKSLIRTLSLNSIIILTALVVVCFVPSFWAISLSIIIGTIATFIATHFIAPWLWTFFERWRIKRYAKRIEKIKKHFVGPDEYIIQGIND